MNKKYILLIISLSLFVIFVVSCSTNKEKYTSEIDNSENKLVSGSCGPGCEYQCYSQENCPNLKLKRHDCRGEQSLTSKVNWSYEPVLKSNLPLGYGSTMSVPYISSSCTGNVNGVMKLSEGNRYGQMYPKGAQMYGMCVQGSSNPFDDR